MSLDGNDYIDVPDPGTGSSLDFGTGDSIAIATWVRRESTGSWQPIVTKNGNSRSQRNYELAFSGGDLNTSSDSLAFAFQTTSNDWVAFASDATITDTAWHHLVLVHTFGDGATTTLYVDGAPVSASWKAGTGSETPHVGNGSLKIGATESASERLNATVDELRVYRRSLSLAEVQALATAP